MKNIGFFKKSDRKNLVNFINRYSSKSGYFLEYCCQSEGAAYCAQKGVSDASLIIDYTADKIFIKEYIDLVGRISQKNKSLMWWCADIASRNRFRDEMARFLRQYMRLIEFVGKYEFDFIALIGWPYQTKEFLQTQFPNRFNYYFDIRIFGEHLILQLMRRICMLCSFLKNMFVFFIRAIYAKAVLGDFLKKIIKKPVYVIKTFSYKSTYDYEIYNDIYFGELPNFVQRRKNLLIVTTILQNYFECVRKIKSQKKYTIAPVEIFVDIKSIFSAAIRFLTERVFIPKKNNFFEYDVSRIVRYFLDKNIKSVGFSNYLYYWIGKTLAKKFKVETVLITYENNPWEHMFIAGLKDVQEIQVTGYQHSIISLACLNMFRSRFENDVRFYPDKIVTVGQIPKNIIEEYSTLNKQNIKSSCGLKFDYLLNHRSCAVFQAGKNILVALEGIPEVYKMIDYVVRNLGNSDYNVRIRTHPVLPWSYFVKQRRYNFQCYNNIDVSKRVPLNEDINWADIVVYWGSAVALEALSYGKFLVHYDMGLGMNYDPLVGLYSMKRILRDTDAMKPVLDALCMLRSEDILKERTIAQGYLEKYFLPVTEDRMSVFLEG